MPQETVTCPQCGHAFPLTEALKDQLEETVRAELQAKLAKRERELDRRERAAQVLEEGVEKRVAELVKRQSEKLKAQALEEAQQEMAITLKEKEEKVARLQESVQTAQKFESELRLKAERLEQEKDELDLTLKRKLETERTRIQEEANTKAAQQIKLKEIEHEEQIRGLKEKLSEAQQKAGQGSQQAQGEALEILLERDLATNFPADKIEPVPKGKPGADVLQRVRLPNGRVCGTVIWEAKRTKNWSDGWISKIKEDQKRATAELAVLVSQVLPEGVKNFDLVDGVVVSDFECALPLATMLRERLFEVDRTKRSELGRAEKETLVYEYLTSTEFRHTAQSIAESIVHARMDIQKERLAFSKMWSKREAQLDKGLRSLMAMWGKMQGHIGSLPDLQQLGALEEGASQPALPGGSSDNGVRSDGG